MKIKTLTVADISIELETLIEDVSPADAFAYETEEENRKAIEYIEEQLQYTEWAWCCVKMICEFEGLTAIDYLGCCSFKDKQDFIDNSGYYDDMVLVCLNSLQAQLTSLINKSILE